MGDHGHADGHGGDHRHVHHGECAVADDEEDDDGGGAPTSPLTSVDSRSTGFRSRIRAVRDGGDAAGDSSSTMTADGVLIGAYC